MKKYAFCLVAGLVFCLAVRGPAQNREPRVLVTDAKSGEPVPFAHVLFRGLVTGKSVYRVTTMEGKAPNEVAEISNVTISCVGYSNLTDTVRPGQSLDLRIRPTVLNIDEVVVTAQYTPEKADKSIYKVAVISARQIEQKAAVNLGDLLRNEVNMKLSQDGVLGTSLTLQGLSGEHVKFLIDGVPLIGRMNGNIDLNQLNLHNVDHVEVIEGPMSVIYGSNALAGVVNIITRENRFSGYSANAEGYAESVGVLNANAGAAVTRNKSSFSLDLGRNFFDGWSDRDTSRAQTFKPRLQYNADGYYLFSGNNLKLKASGQYFHELLLNRGALLPPYHETAFDSWFTTLRYSGKLDASYKLKNFRYLSLVSSWSGYERIKKTIFKDLTTLTEVTSTNTEDRDTTGIYSWLARGSFARSDPGSPLNYQAGFDFNIDKGEGKRIMGKTQQIGDYAGYLSLRWSPLEEIVLQPGIRVIYNTKYHAPLVYALSGKWAINRHWSLRPSWSRGFRSPEIKELYLYFIDINHNVQGNPDLSAEYSNNFNLGLNFSRESSKQAWSLETMAFYNKVDHIITLAQGEGTLYTYINVDHYNTKGIQADLSYRFYPSLTLKAGFAETGRLNSLTSGEHSVNRYTYSTDMNGEVSWRFLKQDLTVSVYYRYTGRMPQFYISGNTITEGYVRDYHSMDITGAKGFLADRLHLSLGVKNLFDNKTLPAVGGGGGGAHGSGGSALVIGWGRSYFCKVSYTLSRFK